MSKQQKKKASATEHYLATTRTATYGFLSVLPLWIAYEALIIIANATRTGEIRVAADIWMKRLLASFGDWGLIGLGLVVLLIGVAVVIYDRKREIPIRMNYLALIPLESVVYAILLGLLVSQTVGAIFGMVGPQNDVDLATQFALSLGAGIYEELVFRVVLVGLLFGVFRYTTKSRTTAYISAAIVAAAIFSAVHYVGALGDPFELSSFTFRFLFGLLLNGLYIMRGFGVAAWTHSIYDVMIVTNLLG